MTPVPATRAADLLADTMIAHGVERAFSVPGESFLALLDALRTRPALQLVVTRHEAGAGLMAVADAKCTGRPGVCIVSRGPGAANAALAAHTAEQDGAPFVLIIGQVTRDERGRDAFQEIDYARMFGAIAKQVWEVASGDALAPTFAEAYRFAIAGTPGPVVVSVHEDVFDDLVTGGAAPPLPHPIERPTDADIDAITEALARAERPLVIAGGLLEFDDGPRALARAAECHTLPVALSYKRQDLLHHDHPLFGGYLGYKIPQAQVELLCEADLILAFGTRLTEVTTQEFRLVKAPIPAQPLVHVYPDRARLGRIFTPTIAVAADPATVLLRLAERSPAAGSNARVAWARRLHDHVARLVRYTPTPREDGLEFGEVVQAVAAQAAPDAVLSIDAGHFSSWVHRLWPWTPANRLIGAVGGGMGIGVPGGVAASLRFPGRQVITFVGDGGFMMTGAELATAVLHGAAPKIFVASNGIYGTIRHHQELNYPGQAFGTALGRVDAAKFAEACGARGFRINPGDDVHASVGAALSAPGAAVVDVATSVEAIFAYMTLTEARERAQARSAGIRF